MRRVIDRHVVISAGRVPDEVAAARGAVFDVAPIGRRVGAEQTLRRLGLFVYEPKPARVLVHELSGLHRHDQAVKK